MSWLPQGADTAALCTDWSVLIQEETYECELESEEEASEKQGEGEADPRPVFGSERPAASPAETAGREKSASRSAEAGNPELPPALGLVAGPVTDPSRVSEANVAIFIKIASSLSFLAMGRIFLLLFKYADQVESKNCC